MRNKTSWAENIVGRGWQRGQRSAARVDGKRFWLTRVGQWLTANRVRKYKSRKGNGAEERTRTSTPCRALHPECSASANSATSAGAGRPRVRTSIDPSMTSHLVIRQEVCQEQPTITIDLIFGSRVVSGRCPACENGATRARNRRSDKPRLG